MICTSCEERRQLLAEAWAAARAGDQATYNAKMQELMQSAWIAAKAKFLPPQK